MLTLNSLRCLPKSITYKEIDNVRIYTSITFVDILTGKRLTVEECKYEDHDTRVVYYFNSNGWSFAHSSKAKIDDGMLQPKELQIKFVRQ